MERANKDNYLKCIYRHSTYIVNNCTDLHCITCSKIYIVNLSKKDLTYLQILLLSNSLSFISTAKVTTHFELFRDFDKFCDMIRLFSHRRHHIGTGKRFPLKRIQEYNSMHSCLSSAKVEGFLETLELNYLKFPLQIGYAIMFL